MDLVFMLNVLLFIVSCGPISFATGVQMLKAYLRDTKMTWPHLLRS